MASASVYTAVLAAALSSEHSEHSILLPEPADLIWGSLCFVVIAVVLLKYALPKFTAILDERTAKIQAGLDFAEQAKPRKKLRNWLKAPVATPLRYATRPTLRLNVSSPRPAPTLREKLTKPWRPPSASLKLKPVQPVKLYAAK